MIDDLKLQNGLAECVKVTNSQLKTSTGINICTKNVRRELHGTCLHGRAAPVGVACR